jgi:hypothetical protein
VNPYSPPSAPVGDVTGPQPLPRGVRILRGIAVAGSALVALTVVPLLMAMPGSTRLLVGFLVYALCVGLFAAVNVLALTMQLAPRLVFWSALLSNCAALAFFVYLHFAYPPRDRWMVLIYIIPAVLNLGAIGVLRRSRLKA